MNATTQDKSRHHHFVTQSWIKRFRPVHDPEITENKPNHVQVMTHNEAGIRIKPQTTKKIMEIFNLYTVDPNGIDNTDAEEVDLKKVDQECVTAFDALLKNNDYSETVKDSLASFFSVQFMRDPSTMARYAPAMQEMLVAIKEATSKARDYDDFCTELRKELPHAGMMPSEDEYDALVSELGNTSDINNDTRFQAIYDTLGNSDGHPDSPHTDLLTDESGLSVIRTTLLNMQWTLKTSETVEFILGDNPLLTEKGDVAKGVRIPMSRHHALILTPDASPSKEIAQDVATPPEVNAINWESAARTRQWLVGAKQVLASDEITNQFKSIRSYVEA